MVSRQRLTPTKKRGGQFQGIDRLIDMYDVVFIVSQSEVVGEVGLPGV